MSVCHVQSTPAGLRAPDHCGAAAWPLVSEQQGLPRKVFRRSIAWLSSSLSTLRSAGYPRPTQDSLPATGQALLDGLSTRRVPLKGFRAVSYISSPFPKLLAAIDPTEGRCRMIKLRSRDGRIESLETRKACISTAGAGGWAPLPSVRRAPTGSQCARPHPYQNGPESHRRFRRAGTPRQRLCPAFRSRQ